MKKKDKYLITTILSFVFGGGLLAVTILFILIGGFLCGEAFHIVWGSNGPIPNCISFIHTDFLYTAILGIVLLFVACYFLNKYKKLK